MGTGTEAELVLVVDGVDQVPNTDGVADWTAGWVVALELVDAVRVEVLVRTGTSDGAAVVLVDPNTDDVLATVGAGLETGTGGDFPNAELSVGFPNMGLKLWT